MVYQEVEQWLTCIVCRRYMYAMIPLRFNGRELYTGELEQWRAVCKGSCYEQVSTNPLAYDIPDINRLYVQYQTRLSIEDTVRDILAKSIAEEEEKWILNGTSKKQPPGPMKFTAPEVILIES